MDILKVTTERQRLSHLQHDAEHTIRQAFSYYVNRLCQPSVLADVRKLMQAENVDGCLRLIGPHVEQMASTLSPLFIKIGRAEIDRYQHMLGKAAHVPITGDMNLTFNPGAPDAAKLMEQRRLNFIVQISDSQRASIRAALVNTLNAGQGPIAAARAFREAVGLTDNQLTAVYTYRNLLERGSADALARALRDRRFDGQVEEAVDGSPMSAATIDRMTERYSENYLAMRAETIARTESLGVLSEARHEATEQMLDQTGIDRDSVKRRWAATMDDRTRDDHAETDGQERGMDEPFDMPDGSQLMYPGDPDGEPDQVINCLLPGQRVLSPDLIATASGWYDGECVTIETAAGRKISVTVNHPILTVFGWMPAKYVNDATHLLCYGRSIHKGCVGTGVDCDKVPTLIEDLHHASSFMVNTQVRTTMNFHGDIVNSQIEVKLQAYGLLLKLISEFLQSGSKPVFVRRGIRQQPLFANSTLNFALQRILLSAPSFVSGFSSSFTRLFSHLAIYDQTCFMSGTWPHAEFNEFARNSRPSNLVMVRELQDRCAGLITLDKVSRIRTFPFSGHVYSPQTMSGVYLTGDGIVNHNCRCVLELDLG